MGLLEHFTWGGEYVPWAWAGSSLAHGHVLVFHMGFSASIEGRHLERTD